MLFLSLRVSWVAQWVLSWRVIQVKLQVPECHNVPHRLRVTQWVLSQCVLQVNRSFVFDRGALSDEQWSQMRAQ